MAGAKQAQRMAETPSPRVDTSSPGKGDPGEGNTGRDREGGDERGHPADTAVEPEDLTRGAPPKPVKRYSQAG